MSAEFNDAMTKSPMEGWTYKKLVDCTSDGNLSYGIVQPGTHDEKGVPIIRVNNVNNGQLRLSDVLHVSAEIENKYKRTRLEGGEVLLTLVGSTGQSVVAPKELAGWNIARAIAVIRPKPEIGANWINICLQTREVQQFLDERANTTVQKTLNLGDVRELPIPIPPDDIKMQIENIAMSLANKIELNRQINQTLEQIAQAIFKSWFVDFEPVKAKIAAKAAGRDPERASMCAISGKSETELDQLSPEQYQQLAATAALFPDALVESELGVIPQGWESSTIGKYSTFQNGYAFKSQDWEESGFPVVKIGSVKPGLVDLSGCSFVSEETVVGLDSFQLSAGDLLVGMTGYPGETGLVPINDVTAYLNQRVGRVSHLPGKPKYFAWIHANLRWPGFKIHAENSAHGSAQANVSGKLLMDYPVCFPGEPLVVVYHETVSSFIKLFLINSDQISKLCAMRDFLLPKLLSGEIDVRTMKADVNKPDK